MTRRAIELSTTTGTELLECSAPLAKLLVSELRRRVQSTTATVSLFCPLP
jgi:hypothetical protein